MQSVNGCRCYLGSKVQNEGGWVFFFSKLYPDREAIENVAKDLEALYEIYEEYVRGYQYGGKNSAETHVLDSGMSDVNKSFFWLVWICKLCNISWNRYTTTI